VKILRPERDCELTVRDIVETVRSVWSSRLSDIRAPEVV